MTTFTLTEVANKLGWAQSMVKKVENKLNLSLGSSGRRGVKCAYTDVDIWFLQRVKTLRFLRFSHDDIKFLYTVEMRIYTSPQYKHNTALYFGDFLPRQKRKPQMPVMTTKDLKSDMISHKIMKKNIVERAQNFLTDVREFQKEMGWEDDN